MRNWRSSRTMTCKDLNLRRPHSKKSSLTLTSSMEENSEVRTVTKAVEAVVVIVQARGLVRRDAVEGGGSTIAIKGRVAVDVVGSLGLGPGGGRAGVTTAAAEEGSTDVDATTADEVGRVLAHHLHQVGHIIHVRTMLPQGGMMV